VLPAANRRAHADHEDLRRGGHLSNEEKLRRARKIIDRELGPIADDLLHELDQADIPATSAR
jgi:hypothetical protein